MSDISHEPHCCDLGVLPDLPHLDRDRPTQRGHVCQGVVDRGGCRQVFGAAAPPAHRLLTREPDLTETRMTRKTKAGTEPTPPIPAIPPADVLGRLGEIAAREKINKSYVSRVLRLTLLAPEIVEVILDGRQAEGKALRGANQSCGIKRRRSMTLLAG